MKWKHPLKGRSIKEAMADALTEHTGFCFDENEFWRNNSTDIIYNGLCSWGTYQHQSATGSNYHSWDSMKDCLKFGFDISPNNEISSVDKECLQ